MTLRLTRFLLTPTSTMGVLRDDVGTLTMFTLEDAVRSGPKVPGATAMPPGRYRIRASFSQRFQRVLPEVLDVPGFTGIRLHGGNTTADTSGCVLVGREANLAQERIGDCAPMVVALTQALQWAGSVPFTVDTL